MSAELITAIALWCGTTAIHGYMMIPTITPEKIDACRSELYQCIKNMKFPMTQDVCFLNQKLNK